jgi:hypothetical protein
MPNGEVKIIVIVRVQTEPWIISAELFNGANNLHEFVGPYVSIPGLRPINTFWVGPRKGLGSNLVGNHDHCRLRSAEGIFRLLPICSSLRIEKGE